MNNIKGIISNEGNVVSTWISRSVAEGTMDVNFSATGDIASPGNEVSADTDQIPNKAQTEITPFPVFIFMTKCFLILQMR